MNFKQWIYQFISEENERGQLAKLLSEDDTISTGFLDYNNMSVYLKRAHVSQSMMNTFNEAWQQYVKAGEVHA